LEAEPIELKFYTLKFVGESDFFQNTFSVSPSYVSFKVQLAAKGTWFLKNCKCGLPVWFCVAQNDLHVFRCGGYGAISHHNEE